MKIRNGFVSNSSSSSFCIYGIATDRDTVYEALMTKFPEDEQIKKWDPESEDYDYDCTEEMLEYALDKLQAIDSRFESSNDLDNDQIYIGINPMDIKDYETGKEFKTTVELALNTVLGIDATDCGMELGEIYG